MLTLTFAEELPLQIPTILPIYEVARLAFPTQDMDGIASSWPGVTLSRAKTRSLGNWISADYGQLRLLYDRSSGAVQASVPAAESRANQGSAQFPISDDSAVELARAFLAKARLVDDEVGKLVLGTVAHLWQQVASEDGVEPPEILDAGVVLTRVIDETPVIGPGGHVMVKILADQTIAGASRIFRPRGKRVETARIMSRDDALGEFEKRLRLSRHLDESVQVLRARFGYFEHGTSRGQSYFEPAYAFVFATEGMGAFKSVEVIQASGSNRGASMGAKTA
jgi:hypothetical protein